MFRLHDALLTDQKYQCGNGLLLFSRLEFEPQRGLLSDIGLTGPQGLALMDKGKLPNTFDLAAMVAQSFFSPEAGQTGRATSRGFL